MTLDQVRKAIATHLRGAVGVTVVEHGGPLTLEEVKRIGAQAPALVVACLGVPSLELQGHVVVADAAWGVFALTADRSKERRDVGAMLLTGFVLAEVPKNRWDDDNGEPTACGAPRAVNGVNLFTTALDKHGVSLWGVRWRQTVELARKQQSALVPFERFFATYDVGQTPGTRPTTDNTELPQ